MKGLIVSSDISVVSRYSGSQESNSLVSIIFGNGLSTVGGSRLGNFGLEFLISGVGIFWPYDFDSNLHGFIQKETFLCIFQFFCYFT